MTKKETSDTNKTLTTKAVKKVRKVVKPDSIWTGSDSFFGWLGFSKPSTSPTKTTKSIDSSKPSATTETKTPKKIEEKSDDFFTQASQIASKKNAVVVRRSSPSSSSSSSKNSSRSTSSTRKWSNINFWKNTRRTTNTYNQDYNNTLPVPKSSSQVVVKPKKKKKASVSESLVKKETLIMGNVISVKELSEKTGIPLPQILKTMLENKIMGGINTALDFDTVSLIGLEFGVEVSQEEQQLDLDKLLDADLDAILEQDKASSHARGRAPIVTVMGHVDHGKTSLLDYIRKSSITKKESGGITQSIGASKVIHNDQAITFIDTPGHELFSDLRARWARTTNVVVIVVAADDGLKPQTIESINHAKQADVPIVVAVTKIDKIKTQADRAQALEKIKSELGNFDLIVEDRGGDVPVVAISSKTWEGIDDLLEHILLQSEMLELQYDPERSAVGVIIDARKDSKQGILTSLIVLSWTLKTWDVVVTHTSQGKIRRMTNSQWKVIRQATWGDPVQILGINEVPEPGRMLEVVSNEKEAHKRVDTIKSSLAWSSSVSTLGSFLEQMKQDDSAVLNIVAKADWPSSLNALKQALQGLTLPKWVAFKIIHDGVGDVAWSDISLAQASDGIVLGYNISLPTTLKKRAENDQVTIKTFDVIYDLTDYIEWALKDMVEKQYREVERGKLELLGVFYRKDKTMVVGGKVIEGKIWNTMKFRVEDPTLDPEDETQKPISGSITSLQREQTSVKEVSEGYECGMKVKVSKPLVEGMILTFYEMEEVPEEERQ